MGRPVELLNAQGLVVKRIDPEGEPRRSASRRKPAAAKKRQEEAAARETARRNRALLATYTSEKDIEDARARALAENKKAVQLVESRLDALQQAARAATRRSSSPTRARASRPRPCAKTSRSPKLDLAAQEAASRR